MMNADGSGQRRVLTSGGLDLNSAAWGRTPKQLPIAVDHLTGVPASAGMTSIPTAGIPDSPGSSSA
jgi:hypothetical protein